MRCAWWKLTPCVSPHSTAASSRPIDHTTVWSCAWPGNTSWRASRDRMTSRQVTSSPRSSPCSGNPMETPHTLAPPGAGMTARERLHRMLPGHPSSPPRVTATGGISLRPTPPAHPSLPPEKRSSARPGSRAMRYVWRSPRSRCWNRKRTPLPVWKPVPSDIPPSNLRCRSGGHSVMTLPVRASRYSSKMRERMPGSASASLSLGCLPVPACRSRPRMGVSSAPSV